MTRRRDNGTPASAPTSAECTRRWIADRLIEHVEYDFAPSRERALAVTKLQEAALWLREAEPSKAGAQ